MSATDCSNDNDIDVRTQLGLDIISKPKDVYKLHKTTRAGATTSLCIACLSLGIPFLVLEPTNRIISETIIGGVKAISGRNDAVIIHIPNNFKCKHNQMLMEENEDYEDFDYLPLAEKCEECGYFDECPITAIQRVDKFDGVCMTYDKLVALGMTAELSSKSFASAILENLDQVGVVILDEAHELMYDRTSTLNLSEFHDNKFVSKFIKKIKIANNKSKKNDFVILESVVSNYQEIINSNSVTDAVEQLHNQLIIKLPWWDLKHSRKVKNNNLKEFFGTKSKYNKYKHKREDVDVDLGNVNAEAVQELIELTHIRHKYNISMEEIKSVFKMLNIITSAQLTVKARKFIIDEKNDDYKLDMNILAINHEFKHKISQILQELQLNKKIIFTSATFCSYDYNQLLLPDTKIEDIVFGDEGDPLRTNDNYTLFCDKKSYTSIGEYSTSNNQAEIIESCIEIMDLHGDENCIIFCRNIADHKMLEEYFEDTEYNPCITYYRASEVMGVKSPYRVGIHIGLAHIPSDSYHATCDTVEASKILAEEQMHCDTWQAASRAKDPSGKESSISFMLGAIKRDVDNICSWGFDRTVETIPPEKQGGKKEVNVHIEGNAISSPTVVDTRNWDETLIMSMVYRFGLYSTPKTIEHYECNNLRNNLIKGKLSIDSKSSLLGAVFSDNEVTTQVKYGNGTFSRKDKILDEKRMNQHLSGNKKVYFHPVSNKMTNFIMFETESEIHMGKLKLFFDSNKLPYVIEKVNNKYRAWIFIKKAYAMKAQIFGYNILKAVNFKTNGKTIECAMYPMNMKSKNNSTEDLIELPFGKDSKILIDGEFVDDLNAGMDIGLIDIIENEIYNKFKITDISKRISMISVQKTQNQEIESET
ncbi:hypothetical protein [Methanococcoides sp. NM1]|uniref:hypothetical protein n=1 Tax=Methanococcoides sp. NM1 TaxID=1201013 RepID=UPI001083ACC7|nr:hypothetical protein [Methanococcoides sp. NM1]